MEAARFACEATSDPPDSQFSFSLSLEETHHAKQLTKIRTMNGLELLNAEPFMVEGCDGPYKDYLNVPVALIKRQMKSPKSKRKGPRGGVSEPFPTKLYEMLVGVAKEGLQHIVSWQPHGRCFVIHHSAAFINEIMPR